MGIFKKIENWYNNKSVTPDPTPRPSDEEIFNVDNFNSWFVSKKDPSIYAHAGIFLRLDKLSDHHFEDYFKSIGLNPDDFMEGSDYYKQFMAFERDVRKDWRNKINNR